MVSRFISGSMLFLVCSCVMAKNSGVPLPWRITRMGFDSTSMTIGNINTCENVSRIGVVRLLCDTSMLGAAILSSTCEHRSDRVVYSLNTGRANYCIDDRGCGNDGKRYRLAMFDSAFVGFPKDSCLKMPF